MITYKVNQAKSFFFDRQKVLKSMDRATARALSKAGAFIRTASKGLIGRKGKKPRPPGKPPRSHTGLLKNLIFFAYEPTRRTVVIGPARISRTYPKGHGQPVTGTVPEVLESGGRIGILEWYEPTTGAWRPVKGSARNLHQDRQTRIKTVGIAARPYMGPALVQEAPKFPSLWKMGPA